MKIQTRYFGEVEYSEEEVLHFPAGLFGFEEETGFLLIPFEENSALYSLQSVATPQLSFILLHPFSLAPDYAPVLQAEELRTLGVQKSEDLYYYVLCAMRRPVSSSTVNMRCPIAVNPDSREAVQVILEEGPWNMRHPLSEFEQRKGGTSPC